MHPAGIQLKRARFGHWRSRFLWLRTQKFRHKLPKGKCLETFGTYCLLGSHNSALRRAVRNARLLFAGRRCGRKSIVPNDRQVATAGTLGRLSVTGEVRVAVEHGVTVLRGITNEGL